ncbi:MAG: hypothetical protein ABSE68_01385 [Minisyncoccia bacterium]
MFINYLTSFVSIAIILAHAAGIFLDFYSKYPNFDMIMHFLGGAFIGSTLLFIALRYPKLSFITPNKITNVIVTVGLTAFIGVLWEFFEFLLYLWTHYQIQTYTDTLSDLSFDILGGLSIAVIAFFLFKTSVLKNN